MSDNSERISSWPGFIKREMAYFGHELLFDPIDGTFYLVSGFWSTKFGDMPFEMYGKQTEDMYIRQAIGRPVPNHEKSCPVGEAISSKDEDEAYVGALESLAQLVNTIP